MLQHVSLWYLIVGLVIAVLFLLAMYVNIAYNYVDIFHVKNTKSITLLRENIATKIRQNRDINDKSVHMWYKELDQDSRFHLDQIVAEIKEYLVSRYKNNNIRLINNMTEINASGMQQSNSDMVYFTRHFDAPFNFIPCRVVRVLLAINGTPDTSTVFNNTSITLKTGMAAIFDYDRSAHYIILNKNITKHKDDMPRITAKLQFVIPTDKNDRSWCQDLHVAWSLYSRDKLIKNQQNIDFQTRIGIIGTYYATYMHIITLAALFLWVATLFIGNNVLYVFLVVLCTFVVLYYAFVVYLIYFFSIQK